MYAFLQIHLLTLVILLWGLPTPTKANLSAPVDAKWKITSIDKARFILQNLEDKKLRHQIFAQSPDSPYYIGTHRTKADGIVLLIYFSGTAGTKETLQIYRTVVFNTKSKKFYGDFPFRVQSARPGKSWPDTIFTFKQNSFTVEDATTNLSKVIKY